MYAALTELEQWLTAASNWLTGAALVISLPLAAYVWHKAAEQKATRAEPRKRKDGMT
jgi:hypothetical protein